MLIIKLLHIFIIEMLDMYDICFVTLRIVINELSLQRFLYSINMKKIVLLVLAGMLMFPAVMDAKHFKTKVPVESGQTPIRTPVTAFISVDLNETTGLLTLSFVGDVGDLQITISQNGIVIDSDYVYATNGGTESYDLSSYPVGEYLLTLETNDGAITQYLIYVEDD